MKGNKQVAVQSKQKSSLSKPDANFEIKIGESGGQVGGRKKRQIERVIDAGTSEPEVFMPFCGATLISEQVIIGA